MIYDWSHMINRALWLFTHRAEITYNLGCSGEVVGRDKIVENNFFYYYQQSEWHDRIGGSIPGWSPDWSVQRAWQAWSDLHRGKMCFDCSGFICWCMGWEGVHKYSSWDFGNMPKQNSLAEGVAGSVAWKQGHVGLDIGYAATLSIGSYGGTINLKMLADDGWTSSHLITGVDYTGANNR